MNSTFKRNGNNLQHGGQVWNSIAGYSQRGAPSFSIPFATSSNQNENFVYLCDKHNSKKLYCTACENSTRTSKPSGKKNRKRHLPTWFLNADNQFLNDPYANHLPKCSKRIAYALISNDLSSADDDGGFCVANPDDELQQHDDGSIIDDEMDPEFDEIEPREALRNSHAGVLKEVLVNGDIESEMNPEPQQQQYNDAIMDHGGVAEEAEENGSAIAGDEMEAREDLENSRADGSEALANGEMQPDDEQFESEAEANGTSENGDVYAPLPTPIDAEIADAIAAFDQIQELYGNETVNATFNSSDRGDLSVTNAEHQDMPNNDPAPIPSTGDATTTAAATLPQCAQLHRSSIRLDASAAARLQILQLQRQIQQNPELVSSLRQQQHLHQSDPLIQQIRQYGPTSTSPPSIPTAPFAAMPSASSVLSLTRSSATADALAALHDTAPPAPVDVPAPADLPPAPAPAALPPADVDPQSNWSFWD